MIKFSKKVEVRKARTRLYRPAKGISIPFQSLNSKSYFTSFWTLELDLGFNIIYNNKLFLQNLRLIF